MTEAVIVISVVTMVTVAVIGFVVQHHIDRDGAVDDTPDDPSGSDTGGVELPRPSA